MRADMAKVIVERPRRGSRMRGQGKGWRRDLQRIAVEELPRRETMKHTLGNRKWLNEHLGPLRRYLHQQVGRPWNKVFAEVCANISRDSAVQDHVRDHVHDYVATRVVNVEGVLHFTTRWGELVRLFGHGYGPLFYVCPATGLLRKVDRMTRRQRKEITRPKQELRIPVDYQVAFIRKDDIWFWVRLEAFPKRVKLDMFGFPTPVFDPFRGMELTRAAAVRHYGWAAIAKEHRRATPAEIRKHCEPLKKPNRV